MPTRKNQQAAELNIGVAFGGVSFGDKTARIGVQIVRDYLEIEKADGLFCDRRLHGLIILGHADEDAKQLKLLEIEHLVNGVFDVKGFKVNAETIGIGLTFNKQELKNGELERFAKSSGRLIVTKSEDIPDSDDEASEADDEEFADDPEPELAEA